jgi:hypothetical protein
MLLYSSDMVLRKVQTIMVPVLDGLVTCFRAVGDVASMSIMLSQKSLESTI